jgi:hypothetical protein
LKNNINQPKGANQINMIEDKLKAQIEEWQTLWQNKQKEIDGLVKAKDLHNALSMQISATTLKNCIQDAYKLLESTEPK